MSLDNRYDKRNHNHMQKGFKTEVLKPFKPLQREAEESISRA